MWSQEHIRHNFPFPQILHNVFSSDHFWVACYGYAIIRFLCLRGLQGVDHCYFMRHAVLWISSFQTNSFYLKTSRALKIFVNNNNLPMSVNIFFKAKMLIIYHFFMQVWPVVVYQCHFSVELVIMLSFTERWCCRDVHIMWGKKKVFHWTKMVRRRPLALAMKIILKFVIIVIIIISEYCI